MYYSRDLKWILQFRRALLASIASMACAVSLPAVAESVLERSSPTTESVEPSDHQSAATSPTGDAGEVPAADPDTAPGPVVDAKAAVDPDDAPLAAPEADQAASDPQPTSGTSTTDSGNEPSAAPAPAGLEQPVALVATPAPQEETIEDIVAAADNELLELELQIDAGEYAVPKAWLEARVAKIEKRSHRFDPTLVRPYTLLGDIASRQGDYRTALDHYGHAVHIQRVSQGLVSAGQVDIVHREADTYRKLGDVKSANEREEYAYYVLRRSYKPYDMKLLPGVYRLADWYAQTNNVFSARALYQHSFDILSANGLGNSLEAIPALEGVARSYRLERFPPYYPSSDPAAVAPGPAIVTSTQLDVPISIGNFPQGERALQQIVQIHRQNGSDPVQIAEAVLDLADWYLLFEKQSRAEPLYDYAYDLLDAQPDVDAVAYFAEPRLLHYPAPGDPVNPVSQPDTLPQTGFVEVSYEVTPDGFARSLRTVESQPKNLMDFRVRKSLRASRFRPALVNGVPVASTDQTFRHEFAYYPSGDAAAEDHASAEAVQ
jgi:tetratricopeptide (TPR) repeat protein